MNARPKVESTADAGNQISAGRLRICNMSRELSPRLIEIVSTKQESKGRYFASAVQLQAFCL